MFLSGIPVFADTITDALMEQARVEGERINAVQRALWLRWLDQYNQYIADLTSGVASPAAPAWSTNMGLIASYLPTGFPTANYTLAVSGNEILATRTGLSPEVAQYIPLYVPLATLPDATTAQLLVTRPTTFVGTEALTKSMVRNSGLPVDPLTSTTFLPGANVTFGSGASMEMQSNGRLEFTDNNGRILGVNELEAARIVPVTAAAGLTLAANTSITGDLSVTEQVQGGSLHIGGLTRFLDVTVNNTTGVVTFSGSSFAFDNALTAASLNAGAGDITTTGTVSGGTGTFTTLNATQLGQNIDAAGHNITGAGTVSGTTGQFIDLTGTGTITGGTGKLSDLILGGKTGDTTGTAYNKWVENSNRVGGLTSGQLIDKAVAAVGPVGTPALVFSRTSTGNATYSVSTKGGVWYKVLVKSGAGANGTYTVSYEYDCKSDCDGWTSTETDCTGYIYCKTRYRQDPANNYGRGVTTSFYVRAKSNPWYITFNKPSTGGVLVKITEGGFSGTTLVQMGGGGNGGNGVLNGNKGGNGGVPGSSGGTAASAGKTGTGSVGGTSIINQEYDFEFDSYPEAVSTAGGEIKIWEIKPLN